MYNIISLPFQDLAQYKKHIDKGVSMAARSLISLFRTVNKSLLTKIDQVSVNFQSSVLNMMICGF